MSDLVYVRIAQDHGVGTETVDPEIASAMAASAATLERHSTEGRKKSQNKKKKGKSHHEDAHTTRAYVVVVSQEVGGARERADAEAVLRAAGGHCGMFLFRRSKGLMVLSLCDGTGVVHHLKVEDNGKNVPAKDFNKEHFRRFVRHYSKGGGKALPVGLQTLVLC